MTLRCGAKVGLCLLLAWAPACAPDEVEQASTDGAAATSAALGECSAIDDADTTCDHADDDCDGKLDEDCDFGPSQCPAGTHVVEGSAGSDWLWGTSGRDCLLGYGGNDVLFGLEGDDVLVGGPGNDLLDGWGGSDQLFGDAGDDTLLGGRGDDALDGGDGNDTLFGGDGRDSVHGGMCQDLLIGSSGHDELDGDDGVDRIEASVWHSIDGGSGKDACSGVSCELHGTAARFCLRDSDCGADLRCVRRSQLCVSALDAPRTDASCDGFDDDCDGRYDEDYVSVATHCGGGECGGTGVTTCVDGEVVDGCTAGGGGGAGSGGSGGGDASCDGVDDDCDGRLDEDYVSQPTSCGTGVCGAIGATQCVNGAIVDGCVPGVPREGDACNALDDDCDGNVDEGFVSEPTTCGVGVCAASGVTLCAGGVVVDSCVEGTPAEDDADCDTLDDDCNGQIDEDYVAQPTSCGMGACAATGTTACVSGSVVDSCTPGAPASSDPSCDGIDDDCDGEQDEDFAPTPTQCTAQGCLATGVLTCDAGVLADSCLVAPVCIAEAECSDSLDNDGDGAADCADADCAASSDCLQTFSLSTLGSSNLWGAGHAVAPGDGDLPPGIVLQFEGGTGSILTFTSVTGTVQMSPGINMVPDGISGSLPIPNRDGVAGYTHATRARAMSAVFLGPDEPADPAPAQLFFADANFTTASPGLNQMFFVGDGRNSGGTTMHRFVVPAGATRLFVGLAETCPNGQPGCFSDNAGSFAVEGQVTR